MKDFSRRNLFHVAGAGALVGAAGEFRLNAQQQYPAPVPATPIFPYTSRAPVSLVKGDNRRKNVLDALLAIDREVKPAMARKKYVLLKVNNVNTAKQLAATHVDAIRGILDYVAPRFKGPVVIAESSSGDTLEGFDNYKYAEVIPEVQAPEHQTGGHEPGAEVRGLHDRGHQHPPDRGAAGVATPGSGRLHHFRGHAEDPRFRHSNRFGEEHGDGLPDSQSPH